MSLAMVFFNLQKICERKKLDKWVLHKLKYLEVCPILFLRNAYDPSFEQIVTCDEKLILYYYINDRVNGLIVMSPSKVSQS